MLQNKVQAIASTPQENAIFGNIDEVFKLAQFIAKSEFFPMWKNKPHDAAVAILFGQSLGMSWGHSLLNISVINGRPTVWGDGMLALCKKSPSFEDMDEEFNEETKTAICLVKRKGQKEQVRTFSYEDAQRAGLVKKDNWVKYPKRMLQMRARAFALRDVFPDVLQGLGCTEEVMDYPDSAKHKMVASNESNIVSFPSAQNPMIDTPAQEVTEKVETVKAPSETDQGREPSSELQQFVDNLAKFDKGNAKIKAVQPSAPPKTAFELMRERLDEQKHLQQVKGMEALERLKTLKSSLQSEGKV